MSRGRAGLWIIPAEDVRVAMARHHHSVYWVAIDFGVTQRTVRRWRLTGLPLLYGRVSVTRDEWQLYFDTGSSGRGGDRELVDAADRLPELEQPVRRRTSVDRHLSALQSVDDDPSRSRRVAPSGVRKRKLRGNPKKRKRLRLSRELIKARGGKRGRV